MKRSIFLLFCLLSYGCILAQNELKPKTVAVFKNGWGFFVEQGEVKTTNKSYTMSRLPKASLGTLWYNSADLSMVKRYYKNFEKKREVENINQMVVNNVGKKAKITLNNDSTYTGNIEKATGSLCVFKTVQNRWLTLSLTQIKWVEFNESPMLEKVEKDSSDVVQLDFSSDKATQNVSCLYFEKGITWIPNYYIELKEDDRCSLLLRAEVMNDVTDLENAELDFVVGVPNFSLQDRLSPTISKESVLSFMGFLSSSYSSGRTTGLSREYSNMMNVQTMNNNNNYLRNDDFPDESVTFTDTKSAGDLFFYAQKGVTLRKGGRAMYNLSSAEMTCEHIYEVSLDANSEYAASYYRSGTDNLRNLNVWHSIRLENKTKTPWTTGNALIVQNQSNSIQPIGQDKLNYTPSGAKATLKVSVANDIAVKNNEKEIAREEQRKKVNEYQYDLITVESTVELKNYKDKEVKVSVSREVLGDLKASSTTWKTYRKVAAYNALNPTNDVCWEITLKPKEELKITYSYQLYARR